MLEYAMTTRGGMKLIAVACSLLLLIAFQNCGLTGKQLSAISSSSEKSVSEPQTVGGNGEPYGGKITKYNAFKEGFYCTNSAGETVASPYSVIEKDGESYKLVTEACQPKNEPVDVTKLSVIGNPTTPVFDYLRFYPEQDLMSILSPKFNFEETLCNETLESSLYRKYGTSSLTPLQMQDAVVDSVMVRIISSFYGTRIAQVEIKENVSISHPSTQPIRPILISLDLSKATILSTSVAYSNSQGNFQMNIAKSNSLPASLNGNYLGLLSVSTTEASISSAKLTCPIYPHD